MTARGIILFGLQTGMMKNNIDIIIPHVCIHLFYIISNRLDRGWSIIFTLIFF